MTCYAKENICAMLCGKDSGAREDLLKGIFRNENVSQINEECPYIKTVNARNIKALPKPMNLINGKYSFIITITL